LPGFFDYRLSAGNAHKVGVSTQLEVTFAAASGREQAGV
jgi:hypothetical protein